MAHLAPARRGHHNLPLQVTPLVGRDQDVASLSPLMLEHEGRLVTLTGVGGCGKTRLALEVARLVSGGVWFIELAAITDPALVPQAVATTPGARVRMRLSSISYRRSTSWRMCPTMAASSTTSPCGTSIS